jgi:hypothetical protein
MLFLRPIQLYLSRAYLTWSDSSKNEINVIQDVHHINNWSSGLQIDRAGEIQLERHCPRRGRHLQGKQSPSYLAT